MISHGDSVGQRRFAVRMSKDFANRVARPESSKGVVDVPNGMLRMLQALVIQALMLQALMLQAWAIEPEDMPIIEEPVITSSDRAHWAFQPLKAPRLPDVQRASWPSVAMDRFVLAGLEEVDLAPAGPAQRATLFRRLKLDLLGLPPELEELEAFLADDSPDAYTRWVDRFLASPQYGPRWSQAWLDLARFAETDGFEHDKLRKDAWRYRDWVIDRMNEDMPYDRFIRLQLAAENDIGTSHRVAAMFSLAGPDMPDLNDQELRRHDRLNEITATMGAVLMGLQFHCAQCHDHKYDPVSQADFYRLRAIFESTVPKLQRDQEYYQFADAQTKTTQTKTIEGQPSTARYYHRGELQQPGPVVHPAIPRILTNDPGRIQYCPPEEPRRALVDWLFEPDHPTAARVAVNRLWQGRFGRGLFGNPSDLGMTAPEPTHPELLDWLASELIHHGWSLKSLHRQIALSSTYRQASHSTAGDFAWQRRLNIDPSNQRYSRFPRHRLDAERLRDAMLSVSGHLNLQTAGPGVMPPLPAELVGTLLRGQWKASEDIADHSRRSIYIFARRNLRFPILEAFDRPDAAATCARRNESITATQALQMLNSQLTEDCAAALASRRWGGLDDRAVPEVEADRIDDLLSRLVWSILGRGPLTHEIARLREFLADQSPTTPSRLHEACLALLNTSEFLYVE
jgi:hypothetical protein